MEEQEQLQLEGYQIPREFYIIAYFALLAMFVMPAMKMHMGTAAIFFSMIGAGIALALLYLIVKFARRKMATLKLSKKGLAQLMVGYRPSELVVESVPGQPHTDALHGGELVSYAYAGDEGDEEDSVIEENPLYIADRFQPNVSTILGSMMLLIGLRRSGKSNLLAVLVEELGRYAVPIIIFDTEDEYSGLVDKKYMPRAYHVGSAELQQESPNLDSYIALDAEGAYDFGKAILDGGLQVVINLKSWQDEDAAIIMSEIIDGLNEWEQDRKSEERIPCMVFLDEAQKWLPQNLADKYVSRETQTLLHHAFFDILVARGGKRGFGLVVAAQRYSQLNKNVLQSLWKFLFLQTEEIDLGRYEKLGIPREQVSTLRQGECFVFSPMVIGLKTMIRLRYSPHQGHTPGLDNLLSHNRRLAPVEIVLNRSFASASGVPVSKETRRLDGEKPLVLPVAKTAVLEIEPQVEEEAQSGPFLSNKQKLALAYHQQGKTGVVELAAAMTHDGQCGIVSNDAAYKLLVELDNLGLIIRRKKGSNE